MMIGPYPESCNRIDGGVAAAITYLSQALAAREDTDLIGVRILKEGAVTSSVNDFGWPICDLMQGRFSLTGQYRKQRLQLSELIRRFKPDIVHGQGVDIAGFLALGCGLPAVVTVHGILSEDAKYKSTLSTWARAAITGLLVERSIVRRAAEMISISPYVTQYYGSTITGRVHEIPNAIAASYFEIDRAPESGRVLFAGRIIKRKGVIDLVRAMQRSPEAIDRLVLAGGIPDPTYERMIREIIREAGLSDRVIFAGLLDELALREEFRRAEVLVLPSYQETAPMVIQQAMAAGLAVVASNICGVPYQIQHDVTGLLFEAGDVPGLAAQLKRFREEASLSQRLGGAARIAAANRYHATAVASATRAAYELVLNEARSCD